MARLAELARFSSDAGGLTRLYLTPEHKAAAAAVASWMTEAGWTATLDAVGTVVGRCAAALSEAPTLILGSHIDTVRDAGRYDGALGVVAAIEAVALLQARGRALPFAVEVVAFGDEEGVRFPRTLAGSRALTGTFDPACLDDRDADGITLRDALAGFGGAPDQIADLARPPADVLGFLEVHIEQGPVLEDAGLPVGIVTAIAGATRLTATVTGTAGHAGTVPMRLRRDALAAAAEMVGLVEAAALEAPDIVATVGRLEAAPGAVNVIPGVVRFTVDLRSPEDAAREVALRRLRDRMQACAARRGVGLELATFYDEAAAPCAPHLQAVLAGAAERQGVRPLRLPSGAGHDGLAMAALCPIAMLFVRCAGGVSHHPAESVTEADVGTAIQVLADAIEMLADDVRAGPCRGT